MDIKQIAKYVNGALKKKKKNYYFIGGFPDSSGGKESTCNALS